MNNDPFQDLTWNQYANDYIASGPLVPLSEVIATFPLWSESFCELVEKTYLSLGEFSPLQADYVNNSAPGQECRLKTVSPTLSYYFKRHILSFARRPIETFYRKSGIFDREIDSFREPFLVRYTPETQISMDEHHDTSLISFSMIISDSNNYEGSELVFPRQNLTNFEIPRGAAIMFPGIIGAPHYASNLISGTRVGLTSWVKGPDLYDAGE